MCKYCDYNSNDCKIFHDGATSDWYLEVRTDEWDDYNDDFVYLPVFIDYCPFCGEKLSKECTYEDSDIRPCDEQAMDCIDCEWYK